MRNTNNRRYFRSIGGSLIKTTKVLDRSGKHFIWYVEKILSNGETSEYNMGTIPNSWGEITESTYFLEMI